MALKNVTPTPEVSFWPAEYRNRPPKVPFIFSFKNFGEFQKFLIRPEMNYLDVIFCFMQLKQHWNHIIIYKYTSKGLLSGGNILALLIFAPGATWW
jgi:hypothetical protein